MPDRPVIAFSRPGPHPYANTSIETVLRTSFPEYEVVTFDVVDALRRHPALVFMCALHAVLTYHVRLINKTLRPKDALLRTPFAFRTMRRLIVERFFDSDVVFSFQIQSLFDGHLERAPHFVYTDHTHLANLGYPAFDRHRLYAQSWIDCERAIYDNASHLFTRSSHITASLVSDYQQSNDRVTCVYAGTNTTMPAVNPQRRYDQENVCFVGVDWERKGGPALLQAFAGVRAESPTATLTIVGCQPEVHQSGVKVVGRVPLDEVNAHLDNASVFCLPTRIEPFGIAFVEAMAHSLPIVATNIGAVPDMVENDRNGTLVAVDDTAQLTMALSALLADPERCARYGAESRRLVDERYSWDRVGAALHTVIANTLRSTT